MSNVTAACRDHVDRQKAATMSISYRGDSSGVTKLMRAMGKANPGGDEWKIAQQEVSKVLTKRRKRTPHDRHKQRLSALYVDPLGATADWNKPFESITQVMAVDVLCDAVNDYAFERAGYYCREIVASRDAELAEALAKWPDRPTLPAPEGPLRA